jgi:hypothetical protein
MRKVLTAALAALTLGGAVCATAAPAEARDHYYGGGYYGGHRHNDAGVAVAAGVVGLALGAALASDHGYSHRGYYDRGYYDRGYYDGGYYDRGYYPGYYGYGGYRTCETTRWAWDPYIGRRVPVVTRYAC